MLLRVECSECGKRYRMSEDQAGKHVPCHECGTMIRVPGRSSRPSGRHQRGPGSGTRSVDSKTVAVAIGVVIGFAVAGVVWALMRPAAPSAPSIVQQSSTPTAAQTNGTSPHGIPPERTNALEQGASVWGARTPGGGSQPSMNAGANPANPTRTQNKGAPAHNPLSPLAQANPLHRQAPSQQSQGALPTDTISVSEWSVVADPPSNGNPVTKGRILIPLPAFESVVLPQIPSPYVAVRGGIGSNATLTVWDMTASKPSKPLAATGYAQRCPMAVSPDGKRVALVSGKSLTEWSVDSGKILNSVILDFEATGDLVEYINLQQIVVDFPRDLGVVDPSQPKADGLLIPKHIDESATFAVSPGGRFVAGHFPSVRAVTVFDIREGKLAGQIEIRESVRGGRCIGLSFSPDGRELAVALPAQTFGGLLLSFDAETGQLSRRFELKDLHDLTFTRSDRSGQRQDLQGMSGGRGWMLRGKYLIDRDTGTVAWTNPNSLADGAPWRVLPGDQLLAKANDGLRTTDISASAIATATALTQDQKARIETSQLDRTTGRVTALPAQLVRWQPVSDPARPAEKNLAPRVFLGESFDAETQVALFADQPLALFFGSIRSLNTAGTNVLAGKVQRARVVDLKSGDMLLEFEPRVAKDMRLAGLSPDGRSVLFTTSDFQLEIWSVEDGQRVATFAAPQDAGRIEWALLTAHDRLLTLMSNSATRESSVSCWELPSLRLVYELTSATDDKLASNIRRPLTVQSVLGVSPNGRFVALDAIYFLRLIDTQTGELYGDLPVNLERGRFDRSGAGRGLFNPDGSRLAALFQNGSHDCVIVWDLRTGREISLFSVEGHHSPIGWCDATQLLLGESQSGGRVSVVDTERHCVTWQFKGFGQPLKMSPDGVAWSVGVVNTGNFGGHVLSPARLPGESVASRVQSKLPTPSPPLIGPGSQVKIEVGNLSGYDAHRDRIHSIVEASLLQKGMSVGSRDGLTLKVSLEKGSSRQATYRIMFFGTPRPDEEATVTVSNYTGNLALVDASGSTLWTMSSKLSDFPGFIVDFGPDQTAAGGLRSAQERNVVGSFDLYFGRSLPRVIYPQPRYGDDDAPGLGESPLGAAFGSSEDLQKFFDDVLRHGDRRFVPLTREYMASTYADLAELEPDALAERLTWSSGLKRVVAGIRWGFGVQLATPPKESLLKTQPNSARLIEGLSVMTGGVGPQLMPRLEALHTDGVWGHLPQPTDTRLRQPVLLGGGNRKELLDAARNVALDVLIIAQFNSVKKGRDTEVTMTVRLVNVDSGEDLFASDKISNSNRKTTALDQSAVVVDSVVEYVRSNLAPQPLSTITPQDVQARIAQLEKTGSGLPAATAVEILCLQRRELVRQPTALSLLQKIAGDASTARAALSDSAHDRAAAIHKLVPLR